MGLVRCNRKTRGYGICWSSQTISHFFQCCLSRFYRISRNFERIYADLALLIAEHDGIYLIDSQPVPIVLGKTAHHKGAKFQPSGPARCKGVRYTRDRLLSEAASGRGGATKRFYGFRLHAICTGTGAVCRFAVVPANEHDVTVAKCLLDGRYDDLHCLIGDKAYLGLGIYTPPKQNAKNPGFWCGFFAQARKSIEAVFSSLQRCRNLALQQLNSFWSISASVCCNSQLTTSSSSFSPKRLAFEVSNYFVRHNFAAQGKSQFQLSSKTQ